MRYTAANARTINNRDGRDVVICKRYSLTDTTHKKAHKAQKFSH